MKLLPNSDRAILDIRKIEDYCLDPAHPRGRHKARVFREALGIERTDALWLRRVLLEAVRQAIELAGDFLGSRWCVDVSVARHDKHIVVRTVWIIRTGECSSVRDLLGDGGK
jgi:hypothetical protein